MRSVLGMFIIFAGLYIVITNDILSFFAQQSVFYFAIGAVICLLITAAVVLGIPGIKKGGTNDEKSTPPN